jgi:hypothetical protein
MFRSRTSTTVVSGLVLVALGCVAFGDNISAFIDNTMDSASEMAREASDRAIAAPTDAVSVDITGDYYAVTGVAQRDYDAVKGSVQYCELDSLGRAGCAYGLLTAESRDAAQARERQDINDDPAGWNRNDEVSIAADPSNSTPPPVALLVVWFRDHGSDPAGAEMATDRAGGVGLVRANRVRAGAWASEITADPQLRHQRQEHR